MSETENQQAVEHSLGIGEGGSLGQQLRNRRKEKGLEVEDVAHHLKLDPALLHAFEEEREPPHGLPEVYCKGFLRNYARYLGVELQPGQITSCKVSELNVERRSAAQQKPRRSLLPFILIALLLLGWLVTGGDLNKITGGKSEEGTPAPAVEHEEKAAEVVAPIEKVETAQAEKPAAVVEEKVVPETAVEATIPPETEEAPAAGTPAVVPEAAPAAMAEATPSEEEKEVAPAPTAEAKRGTVTIRYIDRSWTQVTDGLGRVLVKRMLDAGAVEDFEGPLPLEVNLGNAIGVRVLFNGEPFDHLNYIDDNNIAQFTFGGDE